MAFVRFETSTSRRPLEKEPAGASYRRFECLISGWRQSPRPFFGGGTTLIDIDLSVRMSYPKSGGEGGDRLSRTIRTGSDSIVVADALMNSDNWEAIITRVRNVTLLSAAQKVAENKDVEVFELRATAEAEVAWPA